MSFLKVFFGTLRVIFETFLVQQTAPPFRFVFGIFQPGKKCL